jgi:hypothetical protein
MKRRLLTAAIAALFAFSASAQNYYFIQQNTTTTDYNMLNLGTVILAQGSNDVLSSATPIGFNWDFFGSPVTQYKVSDNGYLTFDITETVSSSANVALPSAAAPKNAIFPFWDGLEMKAAGSVKAEVRNWTYGTLPNRIHVIQWFTASKEGTAAGSTNYLYFAIRLYEGGAFDIIYNDGAPAMAAYTATLGLNDATGSNGMMIGTSPAADFPNKKGSSSNANDKVYKFVYGTQEAFDATITKLNMNAYAGVNSNITISGTMGNYGSSVISSFDLNYSVDGGATVTVPVNATIASSGGLYNFTHSTVYTPTTVGIKEIRVWASNLNGNADGNTTNDEMIMNVEVLNQLGTKRILLEGFSSSTCGPCNPGNANVHNILSGKEAAQFTTIKYQQSYPGTGDPYATSESVSRHSTFYGITSIPRLEVDGGWDGNSNSFSDVLFDQFAAKPAVLDIEATHVQNYRTIAVNVTVKPYVSIAATSLKLHIAIVENTTTANVKTNGETEFFHVLKKMVPNQNGTTVPPLVAGTNQTFTKSYTFPGSYRLPTNGQSSNYINLATENSVEEFSDLSVVVFLQNSATKEIYNANESVGTNLGIKSNGNIKVVGLYPNPATTSTIIDFNLTAKEDITVDIVDVLGKVVKTETKLGLESGDHSIVLNTSDLNNGVYFMNLRSNGTISTQRFVVAQ